jgi:hypothetical protein
MFKLTTIKSSINGLNLEVLKFGETCQITW